MRAASGEAHRGGGYVCQTIPDSLLQFSRYYGYEYEVTVWYLNAQEVLANGITT